MAAVGGNKKTSSKRQKDHYKQYQLENRVLINKIKKLIRYCKKFPNDIKCAKRLAELKKTRKYNPRKKPLIPGSNPPRVEILNRRYSIIFPETPGEQLSRLLGIPLPKLRKRKPKKTQVTHKPKRK